MRRPRLHAVALSVAGALVAAVAAVGLPFAVSPAYAEESYPVPADGVFHIHGHGYGHGRGLNQWGAQGAALQGVSASTILSTYYPGTVAGGVGDAPVRVLIEGDEGFDLQVAAVPGLYVVDTGDGARFALPTGPQRYRLLADPGGALHVESGDGVSWQPWVPPDGRPALRGDARFEGPPTLRLFLPDGSSRDYRGTMTAARAGGTRISTVNTLGMEPYLYGVVPREAPSSWQPAALQAQAVAARSYTAYKRAHASSTAQWDICSSTYCQVYLGKTIYSSSGQATQAEQPSTTAAVDATVGQVRLYGGAPAYTEFASSNGGWSVGSSTTPYFRAQEDPWDAIASPYHSWTGSITVAQLQAAYPQVGTLTRLRITARDGNGEWGGRIKTIVLEGASGSGPTSVATTGDDVRIRLGLRSTWWQPDAVGAIQQHWAELGGANSFLGQPTTGEYDVPGGRAQNYQGGIIYWSPSTGAREVHGALLARYLAVGGPGSFLGLPTSDEYAVPNGRASNFVGGVAYWSPASDAHEVHGAILATYLRVGGPASFLGFPVTDEVAASPGGRSSAFQGGTIYWSPVTGAHEVHGAILTRYVQLSATASPLGFPATDEFAVPGGRQSNFSGGSIRWDATTGEITVSYR